MIEATGVGESNHRIKQKKESPRTKSKWNIQMAVARGEEQNTKVVSHSCGSQKSEEGIVSRSGWSVVPNVAEKCREKSGLYHLHKSEIPAPPHVSTLVHKYLHEQAVRMVKNKGPEARPPRFECRFHHLLVV